MKEIDLKEARNALEWWTGRKWALKEVRYAAMEGDVEFVREVINTFKFNARKAFYHD